MTKLIEVSKQLAFEVWTIKTLSFDTEMFLKLSEQIFAL